MPYSLSRVNNRGKMIIAIFDSFNFLAKQNISKRSKRMLVLTKHDIIKVLKGIPSHKTETTIKYQFRD